MSAWQSPTGVPLDQTIIQRLTEQRNWQIAQIMEVNGKASLAVATLILTFVIGAKDIQPIVATLRWTSFTVLFSLLFMTTGIILFMIALPQHSGFHSTRARRVDAAIKQYLETGSVPTTVVEGFEGVPGKTSNPIYVCIFCGFCFSIAGAIAFMAGVIASPTTAPGSPPPPSPAPGSSDAWNIVLGAVGSLVATLLFIVISYTRALWLSHRWLGIWRKFVPSKADGSALVPDPEDQEPSCSTKVGRASWLFPGRLHVQSTHCPVGGGKPLTWAGELILQGPGYATGSVAWRYREKEAIAGIYAATFFADKGEFALDGRASDTGHGLQVFKRAPKVLAAPKQRETL